jgi:LytS/YehU family sensor histidine kinase
MSLQFASLYLELQQKRFADRLTVSCALSAEELPRAWVPSLILQPLVENAVVHGLAGHEGPVTISCRGHVSDARLRCRCATPCAPAGPRVAAASASRNVRERSTVQFGAAASFRGDRLARS